MLTASRLSPDGGAPLPHHHSLGEKPQRPGFPLRPLEQVAAADVLMSTEVFPPRGARLQRCRSPWARSRTAFRLRERREDVDERPPWAAAERDWQTRCSALQHQLAKTARACAPVRDRLTKSPVNRVENYRRQKKNSLFKKLIKKRQENSEQTCKINDLLFLSLVFAYIAKYFCFFYLLLLFQFHTSILFCQYIKHDTNVKKHIKAFVISKTFFQIQSE